MVRNRTVRVFFTVLLAMGIAPGVVLALEMPDAALAEEVPGAAMPMETPGAGLGAGSVPGQDGPAFADYAISVKASSPSAGILQVNASAAPGAAGYQFCIGTSKSLTKNAKTSTIADAACQFKNLRQGATYYARARAYMLENGVRTWGAWSDVKTVKIKYKPQWKKTGKGYFTYRKSSGKLAKGLVSIGPKTYLFDKRGRQKTGWQYHKGKYRYFKPVNKRGGSMVVKKTVNGVKIDKKGVAVLTSGAMAELDIMRKVQKLVEKLTCPAQSKRVKLRRGFNYLMNDCVERLTRNFSNYGNWHRAFALDVFNYRTGSCFSYGAALAYYANAIGCKSCVIVSSGGHGWAEIDGKVYDAEWSRHSGRYLFAIPYGESGNGVPAYASSRLYTTKISPRTSRW